MSVIPTLPRETGRAAFHPNFDVGYDQGRLSDIDIERQLPRILRIIGIDRAERIAAAGERNPVDPPANFEPISTIFACDFDDCGTFHVERKPAAIAVGIITTADQTAVGNRQRKAFRFRPCGQVEQRLDITSQPQPVTIDGLIWTPTGPFLVVIRQSSKDETNKEHCARRG
ncbi:hypothetical protein [Sphingomonas sp.]|jgi:hypothetical protein|uniref:hypothetical protein n=1 Tax=Sphingomonas sp. TaxID=28214 RepID=UPI003564E681